MAYVIIFIFKIKYFRLSMELVLVKLSILQSMLIKLETHVLKCGVSPSRAYMFSAKFEELLC